MAYGVIAAAVPVFDHRGRVVAALNSSSHSRRITKTKLLRDRLKMLQQVSQQISADLATVPWLSLSTQTVKGASLGRVACESRSQAVA